jgi:hypothetical protein
MIPEGVEHVGLKVGGRAVHLKPPGDSVIPGPALCGIVPTWYRVSENPDIVERVGKRFCQTCLANLERRS